MPKKLEEEKSKQDGGKDEDALSKLVVMSQPSQEPELRTMTIMGDIDEEISKDVLSALWYLKSTAKVLEPVDPDNPECEEFKELVQPIEIIISTNTIPTSVN